VQLGCNKNSRGFLRAPEVAIGAVKLQLVTSGCCTVTAEVASSSLVVPASLQQKHDDEFTREKCIGDSCYYELVVSNRFLSTFHLAARTEIHTYFTLYNGSLGMMNVEYTSAVFKQNSPIVGLQEAFCSVECDGFYLNPHGRDVGPAWNGSVSFGQRQRRTRNKQPSR
jgi:hypothetical protein